MLSYNFDKLILLFGLWFISNDAFFFKNPTKVNIFKRTKIKTYSNDIYINEYYKFLEKYKPDKLPNMLGNYNKILELKNIHENSELYDGYSIFKKNINYINNFNKDNSNLQLGINQFADSIIYDQEVETELLSDNNYNIENSDNQNLHWSKKIRNIFFFWENSLEALDWRNKSILTPVQNQLYCGSCWAFSTCRSLEGHMRINNYTVDRLSEQELIDCSKKNKGCDGGLMHYAFEYCIINKGLISEKNYPYIGKDEECIVNCDSEYGNIFNNLTKVIGSDIIDYQFVLPNSVKDIISSLYYGPIAIGINSNLGIFRFYKEGVIDIKNDTSKYISHAVLLVGFDYDEIGMYWIIQNSWGDEWGENGYAKIRASDDEGTLLSQIYGVYPKY